MEFETVQEDSIHILWFPKLSPKDQRELKCRNSSTITYLLFAVHWNESERRIKLSEDGIEFDTEIANDLKSTILRGNIIYNNLTAGNHQDVINFTISELSAAIGSEMKMMFEWQSGMFLMDLEDSLHDNLTKGFSIWEASKPQWKPMLFVILTTKRNSILLAYQEDPKLVILIDAYNHHDKGAVIACVHLLELKTLCRWFQSVLRKYFLEQSDFYELSFLYFNK